MRRPQCGIEQKESPRREAGTVTGEHAKTGQPQDSANKSGYTFRFNIIRKTVRELIS
jgi:hypothetical protein